MTGLSRGILLNLIGLFAVTREEIKQQAEC